MYKRLTATVLLVGLASIAVAEVPRVALVHGSYGNFSHRDDYAAVAKELGWRLDKFENKDFATMALRLDESDIVLGTARFT